MGGRLCPSHFCQPPPPLPEYFYQAWAQIIGYIGWALVLVTKFDAALTSKGRYLFWTFFPARITLKRVWVSDWRSEGGSYEGKELISWPFCCCHKFQRNVTRRELASLAQWVGSCGMGLHKLGSYPLLTKRIREFCLRWKQLISLAFLTSNYELCIFG